VTAGRTTAVPGAPLNVPPTFASVYRDGEQVTYGRYGNPTWSAFEEALGALEGGHAVAFSSGQAATAAVIDSLDIGAVVAVPVDAYLGTRGLLSDLEARGRVRLRRVDVTDTAAVLDVLDETTLLWLESPTNPMLGVADLPAVLGAARDAGVISVVDNTFATPLTQRPLSMGASLVIHSVTKYLGGHSDLLMGAAVCPSPDEQASLAERRAMLGAVPGVMETFLALRGLRTLPVRFTEQQRTAAFLAGKLGVLPVVTKVRYPGFGAIVSFEVADAAQADRIVSALRLITGLTSLGGVETTIERRAKHAGEEAVPAGLLRMSVGLEDPDDLWDDLQQAMLE
jgi:cystathionine gamma-synthase